MRFAVLALLPTIALVACSTPQESCIRDARSGLSTLNSLIVETQGNINRGYALEERSQVVTTNDTCTSTLDSGETITFACEKTSTQTYTVPVAIDLNAEQAKLDSLVERRDLLNAQAQTRIQQCMATYPE